MNFVPVVTLLLCYSVFAFGLLYLFVRERRMPTAMRAVAWLTTLLVGYQLFRLSRPEGLGDLRVAAIAVGHLLAASIFVASWKAVRDARPGLAFAARLPQRLVRSGPYRTVRHPLYLSYLLAWVAMPAVVADLPGLLAVTALAGVYVIAARREERQLLESALGVEYADYRRRTGMLMPRLRIAEAASSAATRRSL